MSSERKGPSKRTFLARVQSALYANKKVAFVISVLLAALVYFASTNDSSSPYVAKRHGLGAGDNAGELRSALRRKGDGRAAVAIIRVVGMTTDKNDPNADPNDDVKYLVQVKSHDYPIVPFRGSVCLLGGNANKKDATPLDTLKRELNEELHHPAWVDQIDPTTVVDYSHKQHTDGPSNNSSAVPPSGTVHYLGATLHFQSSELISKPNPYAFVCALYEITLRPEDLPPSAIYPRGANIQEGRVVLLTEDQLIRHSKYAWGYEYTMEAYFGKTTVNKQKGTAVSIVDDKTWRETLVILCLQPFDHKLKRGRHQFEAPMTTIIAALQNTAIGAKHAAFQNAVEYIRRQEETGIDIDTREVHKRFAKACSMSIDAVKHLVFEALADASLDFVQAPNEAEAQIAKMAGSFDIVVCSDSDYLLYGCRRVIIVKTIPSHNAFTGSEYKISEALADENNIFSGLTRAQLIAVCLIVGCDFSAGIKKIGFGKAPDLVRQHWDESNPFDIDALLEAAKELVPKSEVPGNFLEQWKQGYVTFTHQRVYDESTGQIQYLRPPTPGLEKFLAETLGHPVADQNVCRAVSTGYYHPGHLQPYDDVLAASVIEAPEEAASKADIIKREMDSLSKDFRRLSKRRRDQLLSEYRDSLSRYERRIMQLKASNPQHPEVVEWAQKEARYKRFEKEYRSTIQSNGLDAVDENDAITWAMLAIRKLTKEHNGDFSLYALKARPDDNGIPLYYEDTGYMHKADRTPTVVKCEEPEDFDSDDGSSEQTVKGRRLKQSDLRRYGETATQCDDNDKLTHRYMQYPTTFRGDAAAYLGELIVTKVLYAMYGGGAGIILNRTYNGRIHDPSGLKEHCFGLSAIIDYKAELCAKTIGICDDQREEVLRQFNENLPVDVQLVRIASKKPSMSVEKKWGRRFGELLEYKAKHGHTNVPTGNSILATWVGHQRRFFSKGSLSQKRIAKLRGIGFVFDAQQDAWDRSYDELLQFKEENGHTNVPQFTGGKLGRWVKTQRFHYRKKGPRMTQHRIARLEKIGFEWTLPKSGGDSTNEAGWEKKLNLLIEYKKVNGHTKVPFKHKTLGSWVNNQRTRKDGMPQHRIDKLDAIGFQWSAKSGGKTKSVSKSSAPPSRSTKRRTCADSVEPPKKKMREGLPKGTKIEVYWPDDDKYYPGVVAGRCSSGDYNILYDDGVKETLDLTSGLEEFRFIYHLRQI